MFIFFVWMYSTGIALPPLLEFHGPTEAYSTPDSCTVDQSIGMYQPTCTVHSYHNVPTSSYITPDLNVVPIRTVQ